MQRRLVTHIHQALGYSVVVDDANDQFLGVFLPMMSQQNTQVEAPRLVYNSFMMVYNGS